MLLVVHPHHASNLTSYSVTRTIPSMKITAPTTLSKIMAPGLFVVIAGVIAVEVEVVGTVKVKGEARGQC